MVNLTRCRGRVPVSGSSVVGEPASTSLWSSSLLLRCDKSSLSEFTVSFSTSFSDLAVEVLLSLSDVLVAFSMSAGGRHLLIAL